MAASAAVGEVPDRRLERAVTSWPVGGPCSARRTGRSRLVRREPRPTAVVLLSRTRYRSRHRSRPARSPARRSGRCRPQDVPALRTPALGTPALSDRGGDAARPDRARTCGRPGVPPARTHGPAWREPAPSTTPTPMRRSAPCGSTWPPVTVARRRVCVTPVSDSSAAPVARWRWPCRSSLRDSAPSETPVLLSGRGSGAPAGAGGGRRHRPAGADHPTFVALTAVMLKSTASTPAKVVQQCTRTVPGC
jgi:hypothetical protein